LKRSEKPRIIVDARRGLRMKYVTMAAIVCCGFGMAGCATSPNASAPASSHMSAATSSNVATARHRRTRKTVQARKPRAEQQAAKQASQDDPVGTIGSGSTANLRPYSPEWWAQERAREARDEERLRRVMKICRAC
jgi:hypothetical protein